jgi:phosphopantetheinyl transferase (holo-ACP synthase)
MSDILLHAGQVLLGPEGSPGALLDLLSDQERVLYDALPTDKRRRDWLLGRAAAKTAARAAWGAGGQPVLEWSAFSVVSQPASGAPRLVERAPSGRRSLAVSLSHGHGRAAAWALPQGEAGGLPGVDLELVRPRRRGTLRFYLHPAERAWVEALPHADGPAPGGAPAWPRDVAAVLLWTLKEAAFKTLQPPRGQGLLDVGVELVDPWESPRGQARVELRGQARALSERLGVRSMEARWQRHGELYLAWVVAWGATLAAPSANL